jgi:taurine dioxygenase
LIVTLDRRIPQVVETFVPFGARIEGLDFRDTSAAATTTVKRALAKYHLLVSRGHNQPDDTTITRFFANFGTLSFETPEVKNHLATLAKLVPEFLEDGAAEIGARFNLSNVEKDGKKMGGLGNQELEWHNDQSDLPRLKIISCLEALDFELGASNTFFCDTYAALEALPKEFRNQLENVFAVHTSSFYRSSKGTDIATPQSTSHPVMLAHPETGRRCLYVNGNFTTAVVGLGKEESDGLLKQLYDHAYQQEFIYEHPWQTGDIVIWDNVGLQHMRQPTVAAKRRTLRAFQGVSEAWNLRAPSLAVA